MIKLQVVFYLIFLVKNAQACRHGLGLIREAYVPFRIGCKLQERTQRVRLMRHFSVISAERVIVRASFNDHVHSIQI